MDMAFFVLAHINQRIGWQWRSAWPQSGLISLYRIWRYPVFGGQYRVTKRECASVADLPGIIIEHHRAMLEGGPGAEGKPRHAGGEAQYRVGRSPERLARIQKIVQHR